MSNNSRFSVSKLHPNLVRQLFFLSFLIFIGLVIISELYFMTGSFLGAVTLYVILMNPMKRLVILYKWKPWLAALILIVTTLILMIIPLAYMMSIAIQKLKPLIDNPSIIESVFQKISNYLIQNYQIEILNAANVQKISDQVLPVAF